MSISNGNASVTLMMVDLVSNISMCMFVVVVDGFFFFFWYSINVYNCLLNGKFTYMLFDVFQCIKNVLAQFDTVESNTVSRKMSRTTVKHDVAFSPGSPIKRCFLVVFMFVLAIYHLKFKKKRKIIY